MEWCPRCNKLVDVDEAINYVNSHEDLAQVEVYCVVCHLLVRIAYCVEVHPDDPTKR